jgi:hypothetical protein
MRLTDLYCVRLAASVRRCELPLDKHITVSEPSPARDTPPELLPPGLDGRSFMCLLFFVLEAD